MRDLPELYADHEDGTGAAAAGADTGNSGGRPSDAGGTGAQ